MKKISIVLIGLSALLITALSYAQQRELATAHDSKIDIPCNDISQADFSISHFDTDKDGNISLKEYLSADASNNERSYRHMDANGDGILDTLVQQEIAAVYKRIHEQYKAKDTSI
jgi:hypothetical protein